MKTETISKPVYQTKKVQTGTTNKTTYIAADGKRFENKNECACYETKLIAIEDCKDQFVELEFEKDSSTANGLAKMLFDAYDISSASLFIWTVTKDKAKLDKAVNYLMAKNCRTDCLHNPNHNEGDKILIADWTESESSDYPSYNTEAKKIDDVLKELEDIVHKIKINSLDLKKEPFLDKK